MKPAPFNYVAPASLAAAVEALAAANGDGKIMAGGQSLVPLLNFRMVRPSVVVDLRKIPGLSFIEDRGSTIAIGALTRHADVERSSIVAAKLPVMSAAMPHVAHLAIRNRGTIGGSIAHADPRRRASNARRLLRRNDQGAGTERPSRHSGGTAILRRVDHKP